MQPSEFDYLERPKQFARDDFWRQVRRTINGEPVSQAQIELIVKQVCLGLDLRTDDGLLDIGCGNGALTALFKTHVFDILGVDYSTYLIEVAQEYFATSHMKFMPLSIEKLMTTELQNSFSKGLLYGVSSYLSDELLTELIAWYMRNPKSRLFIGNIRDIAHANQFYKEKKTEQELSDHTTSIGKWRSPVWYEQLANSLGVDLIFMKMPPGFYLSDYYFDAVFQGRGKSA